ncbi:TLC domain-containing protein 4-like [Branchiostoma floridae x Branchiostoma japonicum]
MFWIFVAALSSIMLTFGVYAAVLKILNRLSPNYRRLDPKKGVLADNTFTSAIITAIIGVIGVYLYFFDPELYPSRHNYDCLLQRQASAAHLAYNIADALMMIRHRHLATRALILHHAVAITCGPIAIFWTDTPWVGAAFLVFEASSPFVHLRSLLNILSEKTNRLYTVTGRLMTAVFFICRVATIPTFWYHVYMWYKDGVLQKITWPLVHMVASARLVIDSLNVYWFSLMMKYLFKRVIFVKGDVKKKDGDFAQT